MRPVLYLAAMMALTACADSEFVSRNQASDPFTPSRAAPDGARAGTCWNKTESPAEVKTVTEPLRGQSTQASATGTTAQGLPTNRSQIRQIIIEKREVTWFQSVCQRHLTPDFVNAVQRALQIRGYYSGPETGILDTATQGALRRFHAQEQIDTPDPAGVSVVAAQRMGLWTADLES